MSQVFKSQKYSTSIQFAQQNSKQQNSVPWYCKLCYNQDQNRLIVDNFSIVNDRDLNKLQKDKVRHSLKRSVNTYKEDKVRGSNNKQTQTNMQQKQLLQSFKFNLQQNKTNKLNNFHSRATKIAENEGPYRLNYIHQNMGSGSFQRNFLPFQHLSTLNSIKTIKKTPQSDICNIGQKNERYVTEKLLSTGSIKFTVTSKSTLDDFEKEPTYNRLYKHELKDNYVSKQDKKNMSEVSTSIPVLAKNEFSFQQLQISEGQLNKQANNTSMAKIKYFKSDISTKQDYQQIKQESQFKLASSIQSFVQFNVLPPKMKISKKSSSSINQSGDIKSSLSQIGVNKKIGIRKVESIVSNQDDDQFSQVIYGQRNFLMPKIHQVEELSRVSSHESIGIRNRDI